MQKLFEELTLEMVYIGCALLGSLIMAFQLVLLLFGGDTPDGDLDALDAGESLHLLSVRSVSGFLAVFGIAGWWGTSAGWSAPRTLAVSSAAGFVMMLAVAYVMSLYAKLTSVGTLRTELALGKSARVYLRIPGERSGKGKISVSLEGRMVEFAAVTSGPEIPTGSEVRIVRMTTENTFEVERQD